MTAIKKDEDNFIRLDILLRDQATRAVRVQFDRHFRPPLNLNHCINSLSKTPPQLRKKNYSFVTQNQWVLIDSASVGKADSKDFDITLMMCLFVTSKTASQFAGLPNNCDKSTSADLARIKFYRNQMAHLPTSSVSDNEFNDIWITTCEAIERLGGKIFVQECKDLRSKVLDPSYVACLKDSRQEKFQLQDTVDSVEDDVEMLKELPYLNQHKTICSTLFDVDADHEKLSKDYHQERFYYWKQKLEHFSPTKASAEILKAVKENQCLVFIGGAVSGKSSNCFYAGFEYVKENGITLLIMQNPIDRKLDFHPPLVTKRQLKAAVKAPQSCNLPVSNNCYSVKTVCVFDDFVGIYHLSQFKLFCWKESINNLVKNKELKILLTCRSTLFDTMQVQTLLKNFKDIKYIHLDNELVISRDEKLEIMKSYNTDADISQITESIVKCADFIPIICELGSIFSQTNTVFLERPREAIQQDLESMKENNKLSFLALSLLVLRNNKILKRQLRKDIVDLDKPLESLCRELAVTPSPSKRCVFSHLQGTLCHFYVSFFQPIAECDSYSYFAFRNQRLFEIVSNIIGVEFQETLIAFGNFALLRDQILFTNDNAQESTIVVRSELKDLFFRRLLGEFSNSNTWDVVDCLQMQCPVFLDEFIFFLKSISCDVLKIDNFFENKETGQLSCYIRPEYQSAAFIFTAIGSISFVKYVLDMAERYTHLSKIYNLKGNSKSLLHLAYKMRHHDALKILFNNILCRATDVENQYDFLCTACENRDVHVVSLFLSALHFPAEITDNIDSSIKSNSQKPFSLKFPFVKTPLGIASQLGCVNIVKLLLDSGVPVNEKCYSMGSSALFLSCENNHFDVVSLLINYKADVNGKVSPNDENITNKGKEQEYINPLYVACKNGNKDIVQILLDNKCDVNASVVHNNAEINVLYLACLENQMDIVRLLLKHGCDVNSTVLLACGRRSPLYISLLKQHYDIANVLIEYGANLDLTNFDCVETSSKNQTLLMITIQERMKDASKFLLETNNVNVNICDSERNIALHYACKIGDDNIVKLLLYKNTQVNVENVDRWTPLHFACKNGDERSVSLLLKQDNFESISRRDIMGISPIHLACMGHNTEIVDLLLSKNFSSVMKEDVVNMTPFHYALNNCDIRIVDFLLKKGVINLCNPSEKLKLMDYCSASSINALIQFDPSYIKQRNEDYDTPLHIACRYHDTEKLILKTLLTYDVDVNALEYYGESTLHIASVNCHIELVNLLLCKGANINVQDRNGSTPLHYVCRYLYKSSDFDERIKYFVSHGAFVNQTDQYGDTPLHISLSRGQIEIAKTLLSCNASVNSTNNAGTSPLHIACLKYDKTIVELLIHQSASINFQDIDGYTPLHNACDFNQDAIAEILLKHDSDVNIQTIDGCTPLHLACKRGNYHIVKDILRYKNPDLAIRDKNGRTALDYASVYDPNLASVDKTEQTELDYDLLHDHKYIKQLLMLRLDNK